MTSYNDNTVDDPNDKSAPHSVLKEPRIQKPLPPYPFNKTLDTLRGAAREISILEDLARTLHEGRYLTVINIQRGTNDLSMSSTAADLLQDRLAQESVKEEENEDLNLFRSKTMQLYSARDMIQTGINRAKERLAKERSFHQQLFQFQNEWSLKSSNLPQKRQIEQHTIDLGSIGTTPITLYRRVPVNLIRLHDNTIDLAFPEVATNGKRVLLASAIKKKNQESNDVASQENQNVEDYSELLRNAQDSVLDQELFELLNIASASFSSETISVRECTDHRLCIRFNSTLISDNMAYLVVTLVPKGYFREISCRFSPSQFQDGEDSISAKTLLRESLLKIHQLYRQLLIQQGKYHANNASYDEEFEREVALLLEKVLCHIWHRMSCENVIRKVISNTSPSELSTPISVLATDYPDYTALRLHDNSTIHIRGNVVDLQRGTARAIPFKSLDEMIYFLNDK